MKAARIQVLIGFFLAVTVIVTYRMITTELVDPTLKQARIAYEIEKFRVEREQLKRYNALETERFQVKRTNLRRENDLGFYGTVGIFSACGLSLLILAIGYSRAKVKRASVHIARVGQHSEIPIHQKDLQSFYPIAVNLSLAEMEASVSTVHDKAYRISRQMLEDITDYTRALAGKRGVLTGGSGQPEFPLLNAPLLTATPTFADLLRNEMIAPGRPLLLGYDRQGQPQYRSLQDLKSVAIAGWQGSGKTLSTGYLVASSVLAYGIRAYVVDPHKHHPESLSALIQPLECTGHITIINPFDTLALLEDFNRTLDRRLAGEESNDPGILLVIDELARLAKMDCFDVLVAFLERCTEETRKANITFIGGSHKWTARHFKGRADIRGCMNSMLIHKTKPSQADLLLEDTHDKHLVKHLQRPGDAILVTDYESPAVVSIPFCTRKDMETVASMMGATNRNLSQHEENKLSALSSVSSASIAKVPENRESSPEVISFERHQKELKAVRQSVFDPRQLTVEMIQEQLQRQKAQGIHLTQAELARRAGVSQSYLSRILNGQCPLNDRHKQKLYEILFDKKRENPPNRSWFSFRPFGLKKAAVR
jgi:AraC-like DNA-binding protein